MCKEGIRIGRALDVIQSITSIAQANTGDVLSADANRVGINFATFPDGTWGGQSTWRVGVSVGGVLTIVVTLTQQVPWAYLPIERYGSLITGPWVAKNEGGAIAQLHISQFRLLHNLEDI